MKYFQCRCGVRTAWSSMGIPPCDGCEICNTTLAEFPSAHATPIPHEWQEEYRVDRATGERSKERVCSRCYVSEPVVFTITVDEMPVRILGVDLIGGQIMAMANIDPSRRLWRQTGIGDFPFVEIAPDVRVEITDGMVFRSTVSP